MDPAFAASTPSLVIVLTYGLFFIAAYVYCYALAAASASYSAYCYLTDSSYFYPIA